MSLLLMSSAHRMNVVHNRMEQLKKDEGTCKNCKYQGNCPYSGGECSRAYYHKIYKDKIKKSVDKFTLV